MARDAPNNSAWFIATLGALALIFVLLAKAYESGEHDGYVQGWSEAVKQYPVQQFPFPIETTLQTAP